MLDRNHKQIAKLNIQVGDFVEFNTPDGEEKLMCVEVIGTTGTLHGSDENGDDIYVKAAKVHFNHQQ